MATAVLRRPYAAPAHVQAVLQRARERTLPEIVDNEFVRLAGVPETVCWRVVKAFEFLDLIHEDGRPTDKLEAIAGAPDEEYKQILQTAVRTAYRDDFDKVDPAKDSQGKVTDRFRIYEPKSQRDRMVILFLGLCRAAGISVLDAPRERKMQDTRARSSPPRKPRVAMEPARNGATGSNDTTPPPDRNDSIETARQPGLIFGISEDDLGALDEEEFQKVWGALGVLARTRAKRLTSGLTVGAATETPISG